MKDKTDTIILCEESIGHLRHTDYRANSNILVIGKSGSGMDCHYLAPNLLQMNSSYVITDPGGDLLRQYGNVLEYMGYRIKCLNLIHLEQGNHYNPFRYIHSDKDISRLAEVLMDSIRPIGVERDSFWKQAETLVLKCLIAYLHYFQRPEAQNFSNMMKLMREWAGSANDPSTMTIPEELLKAMEKDPCGYTAILYRTLRESCGAKDLHSLFVSCAVHFQAFGLNDIARLTSADDIDLDSIGSAKTALFIVVPTTNTIRNFLVPVLYAQLFHDLLECTENRTCRARLVVDASHNVVRTFYTEGCASEEETEAKAEAFLERAKGGKVLYKENLGLWCLESTIGELVLWRGSEEAAKDAFKLLKKGHVISCGHHLPIRTTVFLNEFANVGRIPNIAEILSVIAKSGISVSIMLQSISQLMQMYPKDHAVIAAVCENKLFLGIADETSAKWAFALNDSRSLKSQKEAFYLAEDMSEENLSVPDLIYMEDDKCIVFVRGYQHGYICNKYTLNNHPVWNLKDSLGAYIFSHAKDKILDGSGYARR